jgi:hypothetical protein
MLVSQKAAQPLFSSQHREQPPRESAPDNTRGRPERANQEDLRTIQKSMLMESMQSFQPGSSVFQTFHREDKVPSLKDCRLVRTFS